MIHKLENSRKDTTHDLASRRLMADAGMVGALVFAASLFGIGMRPVGILAAFWPANALLLGVLVRYPRLATRPAGIAAIAGYLAASLLTGSDLLTALLFTAANAAGVSAGYVLYSRVSLDHRRLRQPRSVLYLLFIAAAASSAAGIIGAAVNLILFDGSAIDGMALWFVTDLVNYIAVLPVILAIPVFQRPDVARFRQIIIQDAAPALALVLSCLAGLTYSGPGAMAFPVPALLWCATAYSLFTTACLTLGFSAWTLIVISMGYLPISRYMSDADTNLSVRVAVTLVALAPITVASLMAARSELLQQLKEKNAKLAEADQAKDRFLAMMSHELRTPLTGVLGMVDLLIATGLTSEQEKYTRTLARSARILLSLLNDILDFSKIQAGKLQIEREPFLLSETLYDVRDLFAGAAREKGLNLELNLPDAFQDAVVGDNVRLRQVLSNLIGNAIKFTSKGRILVDVKQETPFEGVLILRVAVQDTGIGIPQEKIGQLFQPFVQADASIARKFGGTGLGLAISRSLVHAMGGEIEVASTEGQGTTFSFSARMEPDLGGVSREHSKRELGQKNEAIGPLRILLAEDNATTRTLISTMLARKGHAVNAVEDGALAVAAAKAKTYDIILIDMHMPGMDGPDAVRAIRQAERGDGRNAHIPIIALTADVSLEGRKTYLQAGADDVAGKPVAWDDLFAKMKKLMPEKATSNSTTAASSVVVENMPGADRDIVCEKTISELRSQLGDDVFLQILDAFVEEASKYRSEVEAAVAAGDLPSAKRTAHALKGASESLGALRTGALARAIELDVKTLADAAAILPALVASVDAAREILIKDYKGDA